MAIVDVGDVLQLVSTWSAPLASVAQNVWHLKMLSGAGADSADIIAAIETQQQVAMALVEDHLSDTFNVTQMELRRYDFVTHRFDGLETLSTSNIGGVGVGDYLPHGVAGLGRIITEHARRQGRTFLPGMTDAAVVAGVLLAAAETDLALYLASHDTDISVTGGAVILVYV